MRSNYLFHTEHLIKTACLLLLLYCFNITPKVQGQNYIIHDHQFKKEYDGVLINKIYQDSVGLVWLATTTGLIRYDGQSYKRYELNNSASQTGATAIFQHPNGQLWVGYENGIIAKLIKNQLQEISLGDNAPTVAITNLLADKQQVIWIATYGEGIFYQEKETLVNIDLEQGLNDNFIYTMLNDKLGRIWVGTDRGISICDKQKNMVNISNLDSSHGLKDNIVKALLPTTTGDLTIGLYENGFCQYNIDSNSVLETNNPVWIYGSINDMVFLSKDVLCIATEQSGLIAYNITTHKSSFLLPAKNAKTRKIKSILRDQEGNLWFSDNDSNLKRIDTRFEIHSSFFAQEEGTLKTFAIDVNGYIWFPSDPGVTRYNPAGNAVDTVSYTNQILPEKEKIISSYFDNYGFLWLGTYEYGIFRFNPKTGHLINITEEQGLANNNVLSITGNENTIWFATLGGVSKCILPDPLSENLKDLSFENFHQEDGLGTNYIYHVFIDSKERAWFATHGKGITVYENGVFNNFGSQDDLSSNVIYSISEDSQQNIFFCTAKGELYQYNDNGFANIGKKIPSIQKTILGLIGDNQGNTIIVMNEGIGLLDKDFNYTNYKNILGAINTNGELNNLRKDKNGNIWISIEGGLIKYHYPLSNFQKRPNTIIDKIQVFFESVEIPENHQFTYQQNHLTFHCHSSWYQDIENISYEYMLEGFDLDWKITKDRQFTYPKLPAGDYSFKVKSKINNQTMNSEVVQFDFSLVPPIWQRPWFYVLFASILIAGLYFFIKLRETRLKHSEQLQKEIIEFQFETLKSQVNPHFLFNSFNTLMAIIEEDQEQAVDYVAKLSDFFRHVLTYRDKQIIRLKEELSLINDYYFLQQKRYGNNFALKVDVTAEAKKSFIPPLTLQLLTENALKHNTVSKKWPLNIEIYSQNNQLHIKNNLNPKNQLQKSTGFGLENIKKRYWLLSDKLVEIIKTDHHFEVIIPLLKSN